MMIDARRPIHTEAPKSVLEIRLNEVLVGQITLMSADTSVFSLSDSYIEDENRPTVSISFRSSFGRLITEYKPTKMQLHPFFSNLLPEGHMRKYLADKLGVNPKREFLLLSGLRDDLPGAIRIKPDDAVQIPSDGDDEPHSQDFTDALHFSLAGIQLKMSAVKEASGGLTIPAQGVGGSWIIKLPSSKHDNVPEVEFAMLQLASYTGLDVPEINLIPTASIGNLPEDLDDPTGLTLAIKRFDRTNEGERIHMEDFAQVFKLYPADKYKKTSYGGIAYVIFSEVDELALVEYIRRLVFSVAIGNADMHLKNWTLLYSDPRKPSLSPAYDFVPTIAYMPGRNLAFKIGEEKNLDRITFEQFELMASHAKLPTRLVVNTAKEFTETFYETWKKHKNSLNLPSAVLDSIESNLDRVPLFKPIYVPVSNQQMLMTASVAGDLLPDPSISDSEILYVGFDGTTLRQPRPPVLNSNSIGEQAMALVKQHPKLNGSRVTAYASPNTFLDWRSSNVFTFEEHRVLSESFSSEHLKQSSTLTFRYKLLPNDFAEVTQNFKDAKSFDMDFYFDNGELWTWNGRIAQMKDILHDPNYINEATLTITVSNPKRLLPLDQPQKKIEVSATPHLVHLTGDDFLVVFNRYEAIQYRKTLVRAQKGILAERTDIQWAGGVIEVLPFPDHVSVTVFTRFKNGVQYHSFTLEFDNITKHLNELESAIKELQYLSEGEVMTRKRMKHIQTFVAKDLSGKAHILNAYVEMIGVGTLDDPTAEAEGLKTLKTDTGMHVNYISKGEYKIVETGQLLRSDDPGAM